MARVVIAFIAAVAATYASAAIAQTQFVIAGLERIGAEVAVSDRLRMTGSDLVNLAVPDSLPLSYPMIIAAAFAVALPVGWLVGALAAPLRAIRFPAAGAGAMALMLYAMLRAFDAVPILGAQTAAGFASQVAAGALGGLVFALLRKGEAG